MKTTLIAATLNEIEAVQAVLPKIDRKWLDEILIVDGGSTDGTVQYCRDNGYPVLEGQGGGYGAAMKAAIGVAQGDIIVEFPPDGNSLPEKIPDVVAEIRKGYDFVIVSRYKDGAKSDDDDALTAIGNRMFTFMTNTMFHTSYTDVLVGFRAHRKALFETLGMDSPGLSWPLQEAIRFAAAGGRIGEIPGDEPKRIGGQRKMKIMRTGTEILRLLLREYRIMKRKDRSDRK
jgi:glycosyltransferase involved in cell wall biosynthesis